MGNPRSYSLLRMLKDAHTLGLAQQCNVLELTAQRIVTRYVIDVLV